MKTYVLKRIRSNYHFFNGGLALCISGVDKLVKGAPARIRVRVSGRKHRGWHSATRCASSPIYCYCLFDEHLQYTYRGVGERLTAAGIQPGETFWFKITEA